MTTPELPVLDPMTIRLSSDLGWRDLLAECLLPGCGWRMTFAGGASRLGQIIEVANQHPCKHDPMDDLRATIAEQEATIQRIKARLPYWALQIEGDVDWSKGDISLALDEMRQTAEEL